MDVKSMDGNEECFWKLQERGFCYIMVESLDEWCPTIMEKAELVSNELGNLVEISKQSIKGVT